MGAEQNNHDMEEGTEIGMGTYDIALLVILVICYAGIASGYIIYEVILE